MPNHVTNVIRMQGITTLPLFTKKDDQKLFDFNKLIPMPKSLNIDSGSVAEESIIYFLTERGTIPLDCLEERKRDIIDQTVTNTFGGNEWAQNVFNRVMGRASKQKAYGSKIYTAGKIYVQNYLKYGCTTWYDWCIKNWGTKWNSYSNETLDENTIQFDTAWSRPEPILKKLAEMYPSLKIEHWWADEDIGYNTGHIVYENGEEHGGSVVNRSHEAYEIYIFCHDGESDCLEKVNGVWRHRNCDTCDGC